jgi:hypothetical protein
MTQRWIDSVSSALQRVAARHGTHTSGGLDLWTSKGDRRVIFEAKTLGNSNAAHQVRLAIAQLLEYRFI